MKNFSKIILGGVVVVAVALGATFIDTTLVAAATTVGTAPTSTSTVTWLYENGLTKYKTVKDFRENDPITREQAAKFYSELALKVFKKPLDLKANCKFNDLKKADKTLQDYIVKSCQLGLFKGSKGNFMNKDNLTNAQAIAVLIRLSHGLQDEDMKPWYDDYFQIATDLKILDGLTMKRIAKAENKATRGEVGKMMYKLFLVTQTGTIITTGCTTSEHLSGTACISNTRPCTITNGSGVETRSGARLTGCVAKTCTSGFQLSGNVCVTGTLVCATGTHIDGSACITNTGTCTTNGTGTKVWSGTTTTGTRGTCVYSVCTSGYMLTGGACVANTTPTCTSTGHLENNICVLNTKSCTTNGTGTQTWSGTATTGTWATCVYTVCATNYTLSGGACVVNTTPTCTSTGHLENNTCVANTSGCVVDNGSGTKTWNTTTSARGSCIFTCNSGFTGNVSNTGCVAITATPTITTETCTITGGVASKTITDGVAGPCTLINCTTDYHTGTVANTCDSDKKSCTVSGGTGTWEQTWISASSSRDVCKGTTCEATHTINVGGTGCDLK